MIAVSVVIPTFNRADLLGRAIESVFAQTFRDVEVIVADDGSTDGTADLVRGYGQRVHYVRQKHTGLPSAARNAGIRAASGRYVAFLDSDDEWLPGKLERQVALLEAKRAVGLVCANAAIVDRSTAVDARRPYLTEGQGRSGWVLEALLWSNFVVTSTAVVRGELLRRLGGFSEDRALRLLEDYDLWVRISRVAEIAFLPEILALYHNHAEGASRQVSPVSYWRGMLRVLDRARAGGGNSGNPPPTELASRMRQKYLTALREACQAEGRYAELARVRLSLAGLRVRRAARRRLAYTRNDSA